MGLKSWTAKQMLRRRALGLVGLMIAFTGVSMILNPTHASDLSWIGAGLLAAGGLLFTLFARPGRLVAETVERKSLGARLIFRLTLNARLMPYFPVMGASLSAVDIAYNMLLSATPALQTEDIIVQLSAAALLVYGFIPGQFARERDFALLFFLVLDLLLVAPLLIARAVTQSVDTSVDMYSWVALAPEVGAVLSFLGVSNTVHAVAGYTAPALTFTPLHISTPVTLVITTACSGIYSFGIFAAAYVAFMVTEYAHLSRRLWLLLALGFAASYVANVLRMVIIVLVGYYTDTVGSDLQNLLLAHSYAGWLIFVAWLAAFWGLLFRYLPVERESLIPAPVETDSRVGRQGSICASCGASLSPAIPAMRCDCGRLYHLICLRETGECPACHRKSVGHGDGVPGGH